jgi:phosphatidylserine synthase
VIFYSSKNGEIKQIVSVLPVYAALLGFLMVSRIPYMHFGKWLFGARRNKKRLLIIALILVVAIFSPALTAVVLINGYVIWGPIAAVAVKLGLLKPEQAEIPVQAEAGPNVKD